MSVTQSEIVGQGGRVELRVHMEIGDKVKGNGQYKVECRQRKKWIETNLVDLEE